MLNKPAVTFVADAIGKFKVCVDEDELNAGAVPVVPTVNVCVPDVIPLIEVIPVAAGSVQVILVPLEDNTCPFVPTDVNPVPPFAIATIPETFDAVPDKVPVIILASKFPAPSLATIELAILELVAVVALLLTFPGVLIVSNLESLIAVALQTPLVIVPTVVRLDSTIVDFKEVPDKVVASAVTVISALPSNAIPLIFFEAANFVAVAALPVVL